MKRLLILPAVLTIMGAELEAQMKGDSAAAKVPPLRTPNVDTLEIRRVAAPDGTDQITSIRIVADTAWVRGASRYTRVTPVQDTVRHGRRLVATTIADWEKRLAQTEGL
jgi:hypothetical protein